MLVLNMIRSAQKKNRQPFGNRWLPYLVFLFIGYTVADFIDCWHSGLDVAKSSTAGTSADNSFFERH
jgi:hypothetical protein